MKLSDYECHVARDIKPSLLTAMDLWWIGASEICHGIFFILIMVGIGFVGWKAFNMIQSPCWKASKAETNLKVNKKNERMIFITRGLALEKGVAAQVDPAQLLSSILFSPISEGRVKNIEIGIPEKGSTARNVNIKVVLQQGADETTALSGYCQKFSETYSSLVGTNSATLSVTSKNAIEGGETEYELHGKVSAGGKR